MAIQFVYRGPAEYGQRLKTRELRDASIDTIVDTPLLETYGNDFAANKRENKTLIEELDGEKGQKNKMNTMLDAIEELRKKNYSCDFVPEGDTITCKLTGESFNPADLIIDEYYRFEGDSNPDDMSVVYALSSRSGTKGIVIDAYGTYSDSRISDFLKNVPIKESI